MKYLLVVVFAILAIASAFAAPNPGGVAVVGPSGVITSAVAPGVVGLGLGGGVLVG